MTATFDIHEPSRAARAAACVVAIAAAFAAALLLAPPALAGSGGLSTHGSDVPNGRKAKIAPDGTAIPPRGAPRRVVRVIRAANRIEDKPYIYGGGHSSWRDRGYDCSGAVSYALRGGRFLSSPLPSSGFYNWAKRGRGRWITIYTNAGHMYAVIAGLRWDTSMTPGDGPGWSEQMRSPRSFRARHPARF